MTSTPKGWREEFMDRFVAVKQYNGKDKPCLYRNIFANELNLPDKVIEFISHVEQSAIDRTRKETIREVREKVVGSDEKCKYPKEDRSIHNTEDICYWCDRADERNELRAEQRTELEKIEEGK